MSSGPPAPAGCSATARNAPCPPRKAARHCGSRHARLQKAARLQDDAGSIFKEEFMASGLGDRAKDAHCTAGSVPVRVLLESFQKPRKALRVAPVVCIHQTDQRGAGSLQTSLQRRDDENITCKASRTRPVTFCAAPWPRPPLLLGSLRVITRRSSHTVSARAQHNQTMSGALELGRDRCRRWGAPILTRPRDLSPFNSQHV